MFKRACHCVREYPGLFQFDRVFSTSEKIWSEWLQFERETGTLADWELANERCTASMRHITAQREQEQQAQAQYAAQEAERAKPKRGKRKVDSEEAQGPAKKAKGLTYYLPK